MSSIKIGYVVATPELRLDEGVTAFQGNMEEAFRRLRDLGYDGAELMIRDPDRIEKGLFERLSRDYGIEIPALCTGEVLGQDRLSFMDPDTAVRTEAIRRTKRIIDFASIFEAQMNVGRLRGQFCQEIPREKSLAWMYDALETISDYAAPRGVTVTIEPIPRVEWNNIFTIHDGIEVVKKVGRKNFRLMADVYAMNIEEKSFADSFREAEPFLAHIHISDSNRLSPGGGNLDFARIAEAIQAVDYQGYVSAEILQIPDSDQAMAQTIRILRSLR
ncbi:MAG: sugar phosphate isomerase/epimerase [Deltaproteobacteria bacterium]|nr:sugar phosphate isomerase/epimerase [Deltaproteobacteria bacterium]